MWELVGSHVAQAQTDSADCRGSWQLSACRVDINAGCTLPEPESTGLRLLQRQQAAGRLETPFCNICKTQHSNCSQPEAAM